MQKRFRALLVCAVASLLTLLSLGVLRVWASASRVPAHLEPTSYSSIFAQEATTGITKANWQRHPKIKTIRAIVHTVNLGMNRKSLTVKKRTFDYCEPYEDTARTLATDSKGRVRYYGNEGGSDDSALKWQHYYDDMGRLRFVFITGGAANGSRLEHRIYFDEKGRRLWEDHVYTKGPGYTFPEVWPQDQLQIKDAATKFTSKSACEREFKDNKIRDSP